MKKTKKMKHIRHRLMTGLFCISLLFADLGTVLPAWAQEAEQIVKENITDSTEDSGETQNPGEGSDTSGEKNSEEMGINDGTDSDGGESGNGQEQDSDAGSDVDQEQDAEELTSGSQDSDEGNNEDNVLNPDEENGGNRTENPNEGSAEDTELNPSGENGGSDTQNPGQENGEGQVSNGKEETEKAKVSDEKDESDSVSENELGEVRVLAASGDNIASGSYGNITWVIDANGRLTVEGSGDYGTSRYQNGVRPTAPWQEYADSVISAEIAVSGMTDTYRMFYNCKNLERVDLSKSDTSNVQYMDYMFYSCPKLIEINFGDFKTGKVVTMDHMFSLNSPITSLDLSSFDTSQVRDMSFMFSSCYKLTELNLSTFNTSQVTTMRGMFSGCYNLEKLDVTNFNTSSVTDMSQMFAGPGVTSLDVSGFDTSNVKNMEGMFSCNSLTSLDVGNFNTGKVTNMNSMFTCPKLVSLDVSSFDTSSVTNMSGMFSGCNNLSSLNLSNFDTSSVTNMNGMFSSCRNLASLDLSNFNTDRVTNMNSMFMYCENLSRLEIGNFNTGRVTNMSSMFAGCKSLTGLDLSGFDCSKISEALSMLNLGSLKPYAADVLYTPYSLSVECILPGNEKGNKNPDTWYDVNGNQYTELPKNLDYSIMLYKNKKPEKIEAYITLKKTKTDYICGDTISTDDLIVTCYGADGSVKRLTQEQYATNASQIDMSEAGEKKLIVTYENGGTKLTAEIILTVTYGLTADTTTIIIPSEVDYNYTYDGQPKQPIPTAVTYIRKAADGTETSVALRAEIDYTISYCNNINAYEASAADTSGDGTDTAAAESDSTAAPTVIVKGTGAYSGTVTKTFTIRKAAAPDAEEKSITASQCAQERPNRTADLTGCFAAYGKKVGYEIVSVDDPRNVFSKTPATADIQNGILTYGTNAAQESDTASITVKVSFANYEDAELTVKIVMVSKKSVVISGITMPEDTTYSGTAVTYDGEATVTAEDGTVVTGQVTLVYSYSGTMADGTVYPAQSGAAGSGGQTIGTEPVNAGSYVLTVAVAEDDEDYTGSTEYPFTISPAAVTVTALDVVDVMGEGEETSRPVSAYQSEFKYDAEGLLNDDRLDQQPVYAVTDMEGQPVAQIDLTKEGLYKIVPSGADAGMNYAISYVSGMLTVMEERVGYTVRFDCMGHGSNFVKSGIKAGSLLELSEEELTPKAEGYLFAGWYQEKSFAKGGEWNFDTDTVQSDLTLYACWLTDVSADDGGLKLCVQEIPDLTYTGSALKPAVTVYDSDGKTLLKAGKDYTIKYVRNIDAIAIGQDGTPVLNGGTAKVTNPGKTNENITDVIDHFSKECPYVVITGKGNYKETIYRNFRILPADISAAGETSSAATTENTPLAAGFTLKYTEQFEAKENKTAKIISSFKYKKALKADKDYTVSVQDENGAEVALVQGKLPLNAGNYALAVTGKGNYTGVVRRNLYVADKQKLMKNASVTYAKTVKAVNKEELSTGIEQNSVIVKIGGKAIDPENYEIDYAGTNHAVGTATMNVKGKNGYVGSKSVTFKITGMPFSAKTIEVKAYDTNQPNEKDWKASMTYTGRAITQNKVTLTAKATSDNPNARNLVYGDDYTITYKNNVKKGTAIMTFSAKPESGYSGSFKKTFRITPQDLSEDMFRKVLTDGTMDHRHLNIVSVDENKKNVTIKWDEDAVYAKNGASLSFILCNSEGMALKQGTDYTVSYKDHKTATKENTGASVIAGSKQPVMTVKGKGCYGGTLTVQFQIIPASIASGNLTVTAARVQKKSGMKLKDFKLKVMDGKAILKEDTDYTIDAAACTPEMIKVYADSLGTAEIAPEPKLVLTGIGNYGAKAAEGEAAGGKREISLADYIYTTKLTAKNLKVEVTGDRTYTGQNVEPTVKVSYYKDNNAAKQGASGVELTEGKDYQVTYGSKNIVAGKNKGSITVTGAGVYGGSVTVKFDIEKKQIY